MKPKKTAAPIKGKAAKKQGVARPTKHLGVVTKTFNLRTKHIAQSPAVVRILERNNKPVLRHYNVPESELDTLSGKFDDVVVRTIGQAEGEKRFFKVTVTIEETTKPTEKR